jgi:hypothetical protein
MSYANFDAHTHADANGHADAYADIDGHAHIDLNTDTRWTDIDRDADRDAVLPSSVPGGSPEHLRPRLPARWDERGRRRSQRIWAVGDRWFRSVG